MSKKLELEEFSRQSDNQIQEVLSVRNTNRKINLE